MPTLLSSTTNVTPIFPTPQEIETILYANGEYRLEVIALNPFAKPFVPARHDQASSSFRGVSFPQNNHWRARICIDKREYTIGDYSTETEAAHAYDIEAIKNYKLKYLNFIYRGINDRFTDSSYNFSRAPTIRYISSLHSSVVQSKLISEGLLNIVTDGSTTDQTSKSSKVTKKMLKAKQPQDIANNNNNKSSSSSSSSSKTSLSSSNNNTQTGIIIDWSSVGNTTSKGRLIEPNPLSDQEIHNNIHKPIGMNNYTNPLMNTSAPYLSLKPLRKPPIMSGSSAIAPDISVIPTSEITSSSTVSTQPKPSRKRTHTEVDESSGGLLAPPSNAQITAVPVSATNVPISNASDVLYVRPGRGRPRKDGLPNKSSIERIVHFMGNNNAESTSMDGSNATTLLTRSSSTSASENTVSNITNPLLDINSSPNIPSANMLYHLSNMYPDNYRNANQHPSYNGNTSSIGSMDQSINKSTSMDSSSNVSFMTPVRPPTFISNSRTPPNNLVNTYPSSHSSSKSTIGNETISLLSTDERQQNSPYTTNTSTSISNYIGSITGFTATGINNNYSNFINKDIFSPSQVNIRDIFGGIDSNKINSTDNTLGYNNNNPMNNTGSSNNSSISSSSSWNIAGTSIPGSLSSLMDNVPTPMDEQVKDYITLLTFFNQPEIVGYFSTTQQFKIRNVIITGTKHIIQALKQTMDNYTMTHDINNLIFMISNIYKLWYSMGKEYGIIDALQQSSLDYEKDSSSSSKAEYSQPSLLSTGTNNNIPDHPKSVSINTSNNTISSTLLTPTITDNNNQNNHPMDGFHLVSGSQLQQKLQLQQQQNNNNNNNTFIMTHPSTPNPNVDTNNHHQPQHFSFSSMIPTRSTKQPTDRYNQSEAYTILRNNHSMLPLTTNNTEDDNHIMDNLSGISSLNSPEVENVGISNKKYINAPSSRGMHTNNITTNNTVTEASSSGETV